MQAQRLARLPLAAFGVLLIAAACGSSTATTAPATEAPATEAPATAAPPASGEAPSMAPLEPANLKFWVFEEGGVGTFQETVVEEFEKANPGVTVDFTMYPESDYGVKIQTAIAAGAPPDLALVFGPEQMREGLLLPLDDSLAAAGIDLSTYSQAIVTGPGDFSCAWEGQIYCMGSYQGAVMMMYNKDMFDAAGIPYPEPWPPMTVEEFIDTACKLTDKDNEIWGAAYGDTILPWEMAVSEDGRNVEGYINSPEAIAQYDLLAKGRRDGCAPTSNLVDPWEQGASLFAEGKLAMVVTDFQSLTTVEEAGINYGTTGIPTPPGYEPFFDVWTDSVGVYDGTQYPEQAKAFINFLTTRGQELQVDINGNMPLDTAVAERMDWGQGIPGRLEGIEVLSHGRPAIFIPDKWSSWGPFYDAMNLMSAGEQTADDALNDAAPKIQEDNTKAWEVWDQGG